MTTIANSPLIDIGVNLTDKRFHHDRDEVLERAFAAGIEHLLLTGTSLATSEAALQLCQQHPDRLSCTVGVHPHDAKTFGHDTQTQLKALCHETAARAIGETGLDFNRNFSTPKQQEAAFVAQLELACELRLPLFLHERDAHGRLLDILRHYRDQISDAVLHCFTGSRQALFGYLDLDLHIGVTGWVCDERRGQELQTLVPNIPGHRLLLETDAPYLLPRDLPKKPKSGRNEPHFLTHICARVAQLRQQDPGQLAEQTTANARRLFRLPISS